MDIKKGDTIKVISGKYKGKITKVTEVFQKEQKILVENVNVVKKATRPRKQGEKGGIIDKTLPFRTSKVMFVCTKCSQPVRLGKKVTEKSGKVRICRKCGEEI